MNTQPTVGDVTDVATARDVVVVGAAGGIGAAIERTFVDRGGQVLPVDRDEQVLRALADELGTSAEAAVVDITAAADLQQLAAGLRARGRGLDVLVNAAGLLRQGRIEEMHEDDFEAIVAVNLRGVFLACKYLVPLLRSPGAIVNLSSVSAFAGSDGSWAYSMTKGGISSMTYEETASFVTGTDLFVDGGYMIKR